MLLRYFDYIVIFLYQILTYLSGFGFILCRKKWQLKCCIVCTAKHLHVQYKQNKLRGRFFMAHSVHKSVTCASLMHVTHLCDVYHTNEWQSKWICLSCRWYKATCSVEMLKCGRVQWCPQGLGTRGQRQTSQSQGLRCQGKLQKGKPKLTIITKFMNILAILPTQSSIT